VNFFGQKILAKKLVDFAFSRKSSNILPKVVRTDKTVFHNIDPLLLRMIRILLAVVGELLELAVQDAREEGAHELGSI
jgi:hypothetical protein